MRGAVAAGNGGRGGEGAWPAPRGRGKAGPLPAERSAQGRGCRALRVRSERAGGAGRGAPGLGSVCTSQGWLLRSGKLVVWSEKAETKSSSRAVCGILPPDRGIQVRCAGSACAPEPLCPVSG